VIANVLPARVPDLLAGIDIALVAEPSPLRLLDCMAAGRAIVAPDHQEVRELLDHERTALLFDPVEAGALARAAARLIADAPLRARLGEAARAEIERRDLTWRSLARRIAGGLELPA
jgi:glycosyltransferase involved in cell wall biosynthesis